MMVLRPYASRDCEEMSRLFYETVHRVNARDYSPAQLDAWASGEVDLDGWNQSFLAHETLVAWEDGRIVGFADMDKTGYLDRLYVHRDCQGRGIATALVQALEEKVPSPRYQTHASITARPFFEKRGYEVVKEQQVFRRGQWLTNFVMEKPKSPGPASQK